MMVSETYTNDCPNCDQGKLLVYTTRPDAKVGLRVQYLRCNACGYHPDQPRVIPLSSAPQQSKRTVVMRRVKMGSARR